jgi:hypothetical protein
MRVFQAPDMVLAEESRSINCIKLLDLVQVHSYTRYRVARVVPSHRSLSDLKVFLPRVSTFFH